MRRCEHMIRYPIGSSGQALILGDRLLKHFRVHRQRRWFDREAGGQLFATLERDHVTIVEAMGPRGSDRRTPFSYRPDRRAEQDEILTRHTLGLHYVGDWHTHRERRPLPSHADCCSIADCVRRSEHTLLGFVIIVVGQDKPPEGLHVAIHDGDQAHLLLAN